MVDGSERPPSNSDAPSYTGSRDSNLHEGDGVTIDGFERRAGEGIVRRRHAAIVVNRAAILDIRVEVAIGTAGTNHPSNIVDCTIVVYSKAAAEVPGAGVARATHVPGVNNSAIAQDTIRAAETVHSPIVIYGALEVVNARSRTASAVHNSRVVNSSPVEDAKAPEGNTFADHLPFIINRTIIQNPRTSARVF